MRRPQPFPFGIGRVPARRLLVPSKAISPWASLHLLEKSFRLLPDRSVRVLSNKVGPAVPRTHLTSRCPCPSLGPWPLPSTHTLLVSSEVGLTSLARPPKTCLPVFLNLQLLVKWEYDDVMRAFFSHLSSALQVVTTTIIVVECSFNPIQRNFP